MNIISFYKEVKSEAKKVSWPSRKDTISASILVFVVSVIFALFFMIIDSVVNRSIQFFLGL